MYVIMYLEYNIFRIFIVIKFCFILFITFIFYFLLQFLFYYYIFLLVSKLQVILYKFPILISDLIKKNIL